MNQNILHSNFYSKTITLMKEWIYYLDCDGWTRHIPPVCPFICSRLFVDVHLLHLINHEVVGLFCHDVDF